MDGGFILVDEGDKFPDAPLIAHIVLLLLAWAQVHRLDTQARVQERLLPHPGVESIIAVNHGVEHLRVRLEADGGPVVVRAAYDLHFLGDFSPGKFHLVDLSVLMDLDLKPFAQGVHHRRAHTVESAGDLISAAAELSAGV